MVRKKNEENEERSKTRYDRTYIMYYRERLIRILFKKKKPSWTVQRFAYDINVFFNREIIESPHP